MDMLSAVFYGFRRINSVRRKTKFRSSWARFRRAAVVGTPAGLLVVDANQIPQQGFNQRPGGDETRRHRRRVDLGKWTLSIPAPDSIRAAVHESPVARKTHLRHPRGKPPGDRSQLEPFKRRVLWRTMDSARICRRENDFFRERGPRASYTFRKVAHPGGYD